MSKSPTVSAWISVADKMPPPNKQILVYGKISKVFFALRKNRTLNPWEYLDGDTCHEKITHWMPLPSPPR